MRKKTNPCPPSDPEEFNLWAGRDRNAVCLDCGANFLNPWDSRLGYCGLVCCDDASHQGIQQSRRGVTRWLREPDGTLKEYDIMTQEKVTETGLVKWEVAGKLVQMDRLQARAICRNATDAQIDSFLQYAAFMGLNPWANEIYLIPFAGEGGAPVIYVGKEAYIKRAEVHPDLDYFDAGTIVLVDETRQVKYNIGESVYPGETLWGAWCNVKRHDRGKLVEIEVMLKTYARYSTTGKKGNWDDRPEMMIRKVALCHGLHESFPGLMDYRDSKTPLIIQPDIHAVDSETVEGKLRDLEDREPIADAAVHPHPQPEPEAPPAPVPERSGDLAQTIAMNMARETGREIQDFASALGLDLAGIGRALDGRLSAFYRRGSNPEGAKEALRKYAEMTGAKPPKADAPGPSPEPSDAPLFPEGAE